VKEEELKKEIYEHLGTAKQTAKKEPPQRATQRPKMQLMEGGHVAEKSPEKEFKIPELTEEPKASIRRLESKVVVDIEMPGVESDENVDVKELENSVEVKAIAGDRAYFKILTKPSSFSLSEKKFEKGRLHLEFA
jgi:HSP20 family molecular chaperone IbpA